MKRIFFSAMFVALAACGPKSQPAAATGDATDEVKSYDIAYIQVEAVLAERSEEHTSELQSQR